MLQERCFVGEYLSELIHTRPRAPCVTGMYVHAVKLRSYIPYELTGARDFCVTDMSSGFFLVN